jgi:hypothetical protein
VEPIADTAADIFYGKMFSTEPSYRKLFPEDMAKQKKALMEMLAMAVEGITNLDELVPKVQDLGRRHAKVRIFYYIMVLWEIFITTLLFTLNSRFYSASIIFLVLQSHYSNVQHCKFAHIIHSILCLFAKLNPLALFNRLENVFFTRWKKDLVMIGILSSKKRGLLPITFLPGL